VQIGLNSAQEVAEAWDGIEKRISGQAEQDSIEGMIVCKQIEKGLECILGMTRDPQFGPALMFGLGGIFVELIKDVSFRVLPIDREDAREMVEETKACRLIRGLRGAAPKDMESVLDFILNCGKMISENPEIQELDVNPLAVLEKGVVALDARVLL
jgi:acyl-CoA synthetase (NDP forming)